MLIFNRCRVVLIRKISDESLGEESKWETHKNIECEFFIMKNDKQLRSF